MRIELLEPWRRAGFRWLLAIPLLAGVAIAADHSEAPLTRADQPADIADVYVWHEAGRLVAVITFAGLAPPVAGQTGTYDDGIVYGLHIGREPGFPLDYQSDTDIWFRFSSDGMGGWNVSAENVPGVTGEITGAVETTVQKDGAMLWAGLRDDPFFFDLEGFNNTLATGVLMFDPSRDSVAGLNCTALVLEMDLAAAQGGSSGLYVWATTAREDL